MTFLKKKKNIIALYNRMISLFSATKVKKETKDTTFLTMNKITETDIELLAIEELEQIGWQYQYGPQIACDGEFPERDNYQDVILKERLKAAIARINPNVSEQGQEEAFYKVLRVATTDLLQTNETFHDFLTNGITVEVSTNEGTRGDKVFLLEYSNQTKNEFVVVNQFTVIENHQNKRPDLFLFINGIPRNT